MTETVNGMPFSPSQRLLTQADFQRVFSGAQKVSDRLFTLLVKENEVGHPRLGLAIAKRRVATAVGRNRIKRQAREEFRGCSSQLPCVDMVLLVNRANRSTGKVEIRNSIHKLLAQVIT